MKNSDLKAALLDGVKSHIAGTVHVIISDYDDKTSAGRFGKGLDDALSFYKNACATIDRKFPDVD